MGVAMRHAAIGYLGSTNGICRSAPKFGIRMNGFIKWN